MEEISTIAHTLKSTSAAIGAIEFSDIAMSIQQDAHQRITTGQHDIALPTHILERLKSSFETIEQQLEEKKKAA